MKKLFLLCICLSLYATVPATARELKDWTRNDHKTLEADCIRYLEKNFPEISTADQKKVATNYAGSVVEKFEDKEKYLRLTTAAIATERAGAVSKCAKAVLHKELPSVVGEFTGKATKANLQGQWYDGPADFYLRENGTTSLTTDPLRDAVPGTWTFDGSTLTIVVNRAVRGQKVWSYKVLHFQGDEFFYINDSGSLGIAIRK